VVGEKMKLYFNGCSFVYGGELENPKRDSFPNVIKRKLDCKILDDSENGSSNQRILRTTLSRDLKGYTAIIGFTSLYRTEYHFDKSGNKHRAWEKILIGGKYSQIFKILTDEWLIMNFLNQVLALQNHFKYNDIPFFFFLSFAKKEDERDDWLSWWRDYKDNKPLTDWVEGYEDLFNQIDKKTFPSLFDSNQVFKDYCKNAGHTPLPDDHPSIESHQLWANYLMEKIND
jgi:hypothetical protein